MLRRVGPNVFEAPGGARIQVVAESQGNNGVNDARFSYGGRLLPLESILGLPGCSFTVADASERLDAMVVFDANAAPSAHYRLFEVENGVLSALEAPTATKFAPFTSFTIRMYPQGTPPLAARKPGGSRKARAKVLGRKATKTKAAKKKAAAPTKTAARTAARRGTSPGRPTSRKRGG